MELSEVYLRQLDEKLKHQNELQKENNDLLKAILKEISRTWIRYSQSRIIFCTSSQSRVTYVGRWNLSICKKYILLTPKRPFIWMGHCFVCVYFKRSFLWNYRVYFNFSEAPISGIWMVAREHFVGIYSGLFRASNIWNFLGLSCRQIRHSLVRLDCLNCNGNLIILPWATK